MRDCTCVGSCRGAEGLGVGWNCVVENGSVEDVRPVKQSEGNSAKSEGNSSRLQWTLDNIYTIARRELRRLERAGASELESVSGDRWGHVLRLCELAGCQGRGVLRDNGGSVVLKDDRPTDVPDARSPTPQGVDGGDRVQPSSSVVFEDPYEG